MISNVKRFGEANHERKRRMRIAAMVSRMCRRRIGELLLAKLHIVTDVLAKPIMRESGVCAERIAAFVSRMRQRRIGEHYTDQRCTTVYMCVEMFQI